MPNTILPLQQEFVSSVRSWLSLLAPATVEGRVTDADVEAVAQLIQSPPVIKLLLTLLYYLYFEYVVGSPAFPQGLLGGVLTQAGAGVPIKQTGLRRRKKRQLEGEVHRQARADVAPACMLTRLPPGSSTCAPQ